VSPSGNYMGPGPDCRKCGKDVAGSQQVEYMC
jgi:hypothetical protein